MGTRPLASWPARAGPSPGSAPPSGPRQVTEPGHLVPKRTTHNLCPYEAWPGPNVPAAPHSTPRRCVQGTAQHQGPP